MARSGPTPLVGGENGHYLYLDGENERTSGGSATGAVGFAVRNQVTLARVFFAPAGDRLILLADLR